MLQVLERENPDYEIVGGNLELLKVRVDAGSHLFAEAGKMVYILGDVAMEVRLPEASKGLLNKVLGAGKRMLAGESPFLTHFQGKGEVGFAGDFPGRILPVALDGDAVLAQRDAFVAALGDIQVSVALQKRLGGALFGGEGLVVERLSGHGIVFMHAGGDLVRFFLERGETMKVDTGSAVAWDETVTYDVVRVPGLRSVLFGGEGLFLTTLMGPGTVVVQTMTLNKLRSQVGRGFGNTESSGSSMGSILGGGAVAGIGGLLGGLWGDEGDE